MSAAESVFTKLTRFFRQVFHHPFFWLFCIVLVVYWPITLQVKTAPYDMTNCWIPWRFYISDLIQNGHFPWWHPYQQMGYPIHSDLQGPVWHYESLLLSMWGRQGAYAVQFALLGYIYVGAIGIYRLAGLFTSNKAILFMAACTYCCSGFFTSHTMHMFVMISAAFIPFILYYCIRLFQTGNFIYAGWAALFIFFNFTGGNHTFLILLLYLIFPVWGYFLYQHWKTGRDKVWRYLKGSALLLVLSASAGIVVLGAFAQVAPYLGRLSGGLEYAKASVYPFPPLAMLSWFNPMATINEKVWLGTDDSMGNTYFGILFLLFFIRYLFKPQKKALELFLLVFGLIALLASFGDHTPVYKFLYTYAPMINKFRFPSYFVYFFLLSALLLAVVALDDYWAKKEERFKGKDWIIPAVLGGIVLGGFIWGIFNRPDTPFFKAETTAFFQLRQSDLAQNLFYYGWIQLPLMALVFATLWKRKWNMLVVVAVVDCILAAQPNLLYIGVGDVAPKQIETSLATYNRQELPLLNPVNENDFTAYPVPGLWQNVNYLAKTIGPGGFNSNYFSNLAVLVGHQKVYGDRIFANPYVYLSSDFLKVSDYLTDTTSQISTSTVLLADEDVNQLVQASFSSSPGDTVITLTFEPNQFVFETTTREGGFLNLLQSEYPGWKAMLDGEEVPIYTVNTAFMGVEIPAGKHQVRFVYKNVTLIVLAVISYVTFAAIMFWLSLYYIRQRKTNWWWVGMAWGIPIVVVLRYFLWL